jgi:hypothetical protein
MSVSLPELKAHLNLSPVTTETDTELTLHLNAAIAAIEKRIGPVTTREFSERLRTLSTRSLVVNNTPLLSVTSITGVTGGNLIDAASYYADPSGVVSGLNGWKFPGGDYDVVYNAGRGTTASEDHKLAILYVAEHLWEMQQGSGVGARPAVFGDQSGPAGEESAHYYYRGFALPRRALELISGDEQLGFA